jgi:hypothetical protein
MKRNITIGVLLTALLAQSVRVEQYKTKYLTVLTSYTQQAKTGMQTSELLTNTSQIMGKYCSNLGSPILRYSCEGVSTDLMHAAKVHAELSNAMTEEVLLVSK